MGNTQLQKKVIKYWIYIQDQLGEVALGKRNPEIKTLSNKY